MIYGYARVSSKGQELYGNGLEVQEKILRDNGAQIIYSEAYTGTKTHRPQLDRLLNDLKPGDTLVVAKLDRIARSTKGGIEIIDKVIDKGCTLNIVNMGKFDSSPSGKLMRTIFLAFAEFERDMIVQRTSEGKDIARQREGWREGRKPSEVPSCYKDRVRSGDMTVKEACEELGISRATWYRH